MCTVFAQFVLFTIVICVVLIRGCAVLAVVAEVAAHADGLRLGDLEYVGRAVGQALAVLVGVVCLCVWTGANVDGGGSTASAVVEGLHLF